MNSHSLNGASINGGIATVTGSPINQTYSAEVIQKTDFVSFTAFTATNAITLVGEVQPASTTIRYAFRFSVGGSIVTYTGVDWQPLVGDGATNGMTGTTVNALTAGDLTATGGFNSGIPYLQLIVYMRTTDTSAAPSLSGVTIAFIAGSGSLIIWANHFTSAVPVSGGTDIPAGTYIWDLNGGYRLEDGVTDTGNAITYEAETQDFMITDNQESILHSIEIDVDNVFNGQTLTVTAYSDNASIQVTTLTLTAERKMYYVGVRKQTPALTHRAKLSWQGNNLTVHKLALVYEAFGRARP